MKQKEKILIIDFGSQFTQLITRRVREANVYSEIHSHKITFDEIKKFEPTGIILSGGPMSVYDKDAPDLDERILKINVPVLGICYGLQLISKKLGGKVEPAKDREYGRAILNIVETSPLFNNVDKESKVWMSHGDYLTELPKGFDIIAKSDHSPIGAVANESEKIYGVQFHPEVVHTDEGRKIIHNFLFNICKCTGNWTSHNFIENSIAEIKDKVGSAKVICALSGGVDSTVAAVLVKKAIGDNLICIHIDTGLMRKNESYEISKIFNEKLNLNHIHIDASEKFISRLKDISDPEQKRRIIGSTFIDVFEEEAKKN